MNTKRDAADPLFEGKQGFNFRLYLSKILSNWIWLVIAGVIGLIAANIYLKYSTPIFNTSASIMIQQDEKGGMGQNAVLQEMGGLAFSGNSKENEAKVLKSRLLMRKVVKGLTLYIKYFHKGNIREVEVYDPPFVVKLLTPPDSIKRNASFSVKINQQEAQLTGNGEDDSRVVALYKPFVLEGIGTLQIEPTGNISGQQEYLFTISSLKAAVASFAGRLSVSIPDKQLDIVDLGFSYPVPRRSEDILNRLVEEYIKTTIEDKNRIADSTIAFIENRLVYVSQELGDVEGNIQSFRQENQLADLSQQASLLISSTSQYTEQLSQIETQLSILNALESYVSDRTHERVVPGSALPDNPVFAGLVDRYNILVIEKEKGRLNQTDDSPYIKSLNEQINSLRRDMLSSLSNTRQALQITRDRVQSRSNVVRGQIRDVPSKERNFLDLARQQQIKQELYVFLLQKREETAISKTANTSNCKIIEAPESYGPVSPNRNNVLAYGFLLCLSVPLGAIFLSVWLNKKILTKEDIVNNINVPVIAEIGSSEDKDQTVVVTRESRTPISEQFRSLRTNLSFFLKEDEKVILLTSSISGEGKSFVSINLAMALAISGKRVVVMEADLRKPNLSNKLHIDNNYGFTSYVISADIQPSDITKQSDIHEGLYIISSGPIPPNPTETILSRKTDALMAYLTQNFEYIIIDAPPVGLVTDAQLLSKYADLTLYLIRQKYSYKDQLSIPEDIYQNNKMKNIALVINDIKTNGSYGYSYGYGYGYGEYGREPINSTIFGRTWFGKR